jgi:outer membrane protein assembly factor BamE (lipoprotein component of BamABCDE complex)
MTSQFSKLLPALAVALTLSACASLGSPPPKADQVARVHPGLTQDEVRSLVGVPGNVTGDSRKHETMWIYSFTDLWGYPSELDVTFGANGLVTESFAQRTEG